MKQLIEHILKNCMQKYIVYILFSICSITDTFNSTISTLPNINRLKINALQTQVAALSDQVRQGFADTFIIIANTEIVVEVIVNACCDTLSS